MRIDLKQPPGFTLIEIVVVMVILLLLAVLAVPNFRVVYDRMAFRQSVQDIVYSLRYAQGLAMARSYRLRLVSNGDHSAFWLEKEKAAGSADAGSGEFERVQGRTVKKQVVPDGVRVEADGLPVDCFEDGHFSKAEISFCFRTECLVISTREQRFKVDLMEWQAGEEHAR